MSISSEEPEWWGTSRAPIGLDLLCTVLYCSFKTLGQEGAHIGGDIGWKKIS